MKERKKDREKIKIKSNKKKIKLENRLEKTQNK